MQEKMSLSLNTSSCLYGSKRLSEEVSAKFLGESRVLDPIWDD